MDLFDRASVTTSEDVPLAYRMRPLTLNDYVG